jgi:hypothetical protein
MNWLRKRRKTEETIEVRKEPYRELRQAEMDRACGVGEDAPQSLLAVHLARTMRDAAVLEMRNILRQGNLRETPDVQQGMLVQAAARMDAACEFEERWIGLFAEWRERTEREIKKAMGK